MPKCFSAWNPIFNQSVTMHFKNRYWFCQMTVLGIYLGRAWYCIFCLKVLGCRTPARPNQLHRHGLVTLPSEPQGNGAAKRPSTGIGSKKGEQMPKNNRNSKDIKRVKKMQIKQGAWKQTIPPFGIFWLHDKLHLGKSCMNQSWYKSAWKPPETWVKCSKTLFSTLKSAAKFSPNTSPTCRSGVTAVADVAERSKLEQLEDAGGCWKVGMFVVCSRKAG